jgi:outer membrane protein TolC
MQNLHKIRLKKIYVSCIFALYSDFLLADAFQTPELAPLQLEKYSEKPAKDIEQDLSQLRDQSETLQKPLNLSLPDLKSLQEKSVTATSGYQVSIADIRKMALANNLGLKVYQLDPQIAQTELREERAKFDNIVFANVQYGEKDKLSNSLGSVKFSSDDTDLNNQQLKLSALESESRLLEGEVGLFIPMRSGAKVKISTPFNKSESRYDSEKFDSKEATSALKFSISQPLLRNAGRNVNEASIQIADLEKQAVDAKTQLQAIRVLTTVEKAYWEVNRAWGELEVRQKQYEYATQNLQMVRKRVQEGLSAAIEINRAEIGVADRMEALIVANTKLKIADRLLKFYLNEPNTPLSADQQFVTNTPPELLFYAIDREKLVSKALQNRLELLELELKLSADLSKISYLENQTLPVFNIDYQYGALSEIRNNFGGAYGSIGGGDPNEWAFGLSFEMPITNEARKAQLERAVLTRQQRLATKTLQELSIQREILDTADEINQNWQRIVAARQQVIIAGINYEAELKQFKEGLRTMTEVLESLTRLGEAQMKEIRAVNDYQITKVDLAYATGTVLGYSNVETK